MHTLGLYFKVTSRHFHGQPVHLTRCLGIHSTKKKANLRHFRQANTTPSVHLPKAVTVLLPSLLELSTIVQSFNILDKAAVTKAGFYGAEEKMKRVEQKFRHYREAVVMKEPSPRSAALPCLLFSPALRALLTDSE